MEYRKQEKKQKSALTCVDENFLHAHTLPSRSVNWNDNPQQAGLHGLELSEFNQEESIIVPGVYGDTEVINTG
jgi:hypothetical protein